MHPQFFFQADFDEFICHDELFIKMKSLAGLLRERTPDMKTGTVGKDVKKMVRIGSDFKSTSSLGQTTLSNIDISFIFNVST